MYHVTDYVSLHLICLNSKLKHYYFRSYTSDRSYKCPVFGKIEPLQQNNIALSHV